MKTEVIKENKTIEATEERVVYTSVDGVQFTSETECKEYETALKKVYNTRVQPKFKIVNENDFFSNWAGSEEFEYGVIKVTKDNYDDLRMWADVNGIYENIHLGDPKEVEPQKFTKDFIGKIVIFGLGWLWNDNNCYDNVSFYGTATDFVAYLTANMVKALEI